MKRKTVQRGVALLLCGAMLCGTMTGCSSVTPHGNTLTDTARDENNKASVGAPIPLSGFEDVSDGNRKCAYRMLAELTDTYTFTCDRAESISVTTPAGTVQGGDSVQASINEGDTVTVEVTTEEPEQKFLLEAQADNHLQRLPYEQNFTVDLDSIPLESTGEIEPTTISYQKREGGTYVYLNNPEKLQMQDVGEAILRDEGLHGDVQVTWEHSNFTGVHIYLGYQLKNEGDTDVYVTVTNIGMQVEGEWLGQQSWSDYYNYKFDLPEDYFDSQGKESERYKGQNFLDYTPRVYQPTTYRIPAGEYIYVLGGTTEDAYNKTNVAETADLLIGKGHCTNAVAKMFITGGEVTGTFYCYANSKQIEEEKEEQGFILDRDGETYGWQYKGVDYHQALIESNPVFIVNDDTTVNRLPVTFEYSQDPLAPFKDEPYQEYDSKIKTYRGSTWATNINQQGGGRAVGTDMSTFECVTTDGETVTIGVDCADGYGDPANLGNWMIDYHDNMTFVNQGDQPRTFTINKSAQGALMAMVIDAEGKVLSTKCTIVPIEEPADSRQWKIYEVEVAPHSAVQLTVSFLLMGNSYGNVNHWVTVR